MGIRYDFHTEEIVEVEDKHCDWLKSLQNTNRLKNIDNVLGLT